MPPDAELSSTSRPRAKRPQRPRRILARAPGCRLIAIGDYAQRRDVPRSTTAGFAGRFVEPRKIDDLLQLLELPAP